MREPGGAGSCRVRRCSRSRLCLFGQGSAAAWMVLRQLLEDGVVVRYHGDFDWPGVGIAARAVIWLEGSPGGWAPTITSRDPATTEREPLDEGHPTENVGSPARRLMAEQDAVAHEESVISALLADLTRIP